MKTGPEAHRAVGTKTAPGLNLRGTRFAPVSSPPLFR